MKRISFFLVILCALALSLGSTAFAANTGALSIIKVTGQFGSTDSVMAGATVKFYIRADNGSPSAATGAAMDISNGFRISDGGTGTTWNSTSIVASTSANFPNWFGTNWGISAYSPDGLLSDTAGFFGAGGGTGPGDTKMPAGFNDTIVVITAAFTANPANEGKKICIDSAFLPPSLAWEWLMPDFTPKTPEWTSTLGQATVGYGYCWYVYTVPNLCPDVDDPNPLGITVSHCGPFDYDFTATDNESDPAIFSFDAPSPGGFSLPTNTSVHWSAATLAPGNYVVSVHATDGLCTGFGHTGLLNVQSTNANPSFTAGCGTITQMSTGATKTVDMNATDADACDIPTLVFTIAPATAGLSINAGNGEVSFTPAGPGLYVFTVTVTDQFGGSADCDITFDVSASSGYVVRIEKTHNTLQGNFEDVDVLLQKALLDGLGGFSFLISYDNSALSLQGANTITSDLYGPNPDCGWESFTYRFGANGNCSGGCPSGLVTVVGIAETNNGNNHPNALCVPNYIPTIPPDVIMFTLKFLVSNDATLNCSYVPIRFFWVDCTDNTLSDAAGEDLYIANRVFDYMNQDVEIDPLLASFPGWAGVPAGFCANPDPNKPQPIRDIDFYDGGIDIICGDSIDAVGDINLNGTAYEIADAVMFSNYFVYGYSALVYVLPYGYAGSIAASDANRDGLTLTVADLVYLIRVVIGDALPYNKLSPVAVNYTSDNGRLSAQGELGAAYVVVEGNATLTLLAHNMNMESKFDGKNTHVLVAPHVYEGMTSMETFSGDFLAVNGTIISVDLSTPDGATVLAKPVPTAYSLKQNYPNPFNPSTTIEFALPVASNYTLTVYNITGQKVWSTAGSGEAGSHSAVWDATGNSSGIYFYKLEAGSFSATKKMALLK